MRNKNSIIGCILGFFMMIAGFIGMIWKAIETIIYRFQNPDYTQYRVMLERPDLTIYGIIFIILCIIGSFISTHFLNK